MRYSVMIKGHRVYCQTASDLLDLLRQAESSASPKQERASPVSSRASPRDPKIVQILEAVVQAGQEGIDTHELAKQFGHKKGQDLGGYIGSANAALLAGKMKFEDAIESKRDGAGNRRWYPGTRIRDAIRLLKEAIE